MPVRAALTLLVFATGCFPEVGDCDPIAAQRPVYDQDGVPAYEGQALVLASCASNGVCHGEPDETRLDARFGVPAALTFDVQLASFDNQIRDGEVARQRRARFRILQVSGNVLDVVHRRQMPPPSDGPDSPAELFYAQAPAYSNADGEPLPPANSDDGMEILRNWLACGAPVVERTVARPDGVESVTAARLIRTPLEPTWTSIYTDLLSTRCNSAICHGGNPDAGFRVLNDDPGGTLDSLLSGAASTATGLDCAEDGSALLVPGDPDASLLYRKITGSPTCGDTMPPGGSISDENRMAIQQWIEDGANP